MQVKWKCVLKKVIAPIVAVLVVMTIGFIFVCIFLDSYNNTYNNTNMTMTNQHLVQYHESWNLTPVYIWIVIPMGFIFLVALIRSMLKPCIIKEMGIVDNITSGISMIFDCICFIMSLVFCIGGLFMIILMVNEIFRVVSGSGFNNSLLAIGFFIISASILSILSWMVFPSNLKKIVESE